MTDRHGRDWSVQPPHVHPPYKSTLSRGPKQPLVTLPAAGLPAPGPVFNSTDVPAADSDLTRNASAAGEALGERIIVYGRVTDERGRPVCGSLVEIWQANAAGRYNHDRDTHDAPLDPNFFGAGRTLTDDDGRYRFVTVKPGAYPWGNHHNAWRPAHVHFSLFGAGIDARLVTQMYFPGDPLLLLDPIFNFTADETIKSRLVSRFCIDRTQPGWALAYEFNLVLCGRAATPMVD